MIYDDWLTDLQRLNKKISGLAIQRYESFYEDLSRVRSKVLIRQIVYAQVHTQMLAGIASELDRECLQYIEGTWNDSRALARLSGDTIDRRIANVGIKQINDSLTVFADLLANGTSLQTLQKLVAMFLKEVVDLTPGLEVIKIAWKLRDLDEALGQTEISTNEADRALMKLEAFDSIAYSAAVSAIVAVNSLVNPASVETLKSSIPDLARQAMSAASDRIDRMLADKLAGYPAEVRA